MHVGFLLRHVSTKLILRSYDERCPQYIQSDPVKELNSTSIIDAEESVVTLSGDYINLFTSNHGNQQQQQREDLSRTLISV